MPRLTPIPLVFNKLIWSDKHSFEFHFTDWVGMASPKSSLPVLPEIEKFKGIEMLCFCGDKEKDSLCNILDPMLGKRIVLKGGHHLGGDYEAIAETILNEFR